MNELNGISFTKEDTLSIKGVAISLLLFHHLFYQAKYFEQCSLRTFIPQQFVIDIAVAARVCVWIFAFCSAYGIHTLLKKREQVRYSQFLVDRWVPLMGSFWVLYILSFILLLILKKEPFEIYDHNIVYVLLDFMGLSDFAQTPKMFGVFWYMFFAQTVVLFVPVLSALVKKFGWYVLPVAFFAIPFMGEGIKSSQGGNYYNYLLVIILGILFSEYSVFERIKNRYSGPGWGAVDLVLIIGLLWLKLKVANLDGSIETRNLQGAVTSFAAVMICIFVFIYIKGWFRKVLIFLGKHSGNIFIIHAFIKTYYRKQICFSGYVILSWLILLLVSLGISILIEQGKKLTHYNQNLKAIKEKCQRRAAS